MFGDVTFLPPMEAWQSGLLPYPLLLLSQLIILGVQVKISYDLWAASGFFVTRRPMAGMILRRLSYVYFAVMVLRYIITMTLYPDRRWFTGTIPIWFHFVLAGYLFTLGRYLARGEDDTLEANSHSAIDAS